MSKYRVTVQVPASKKQPSFIAAVELQAKTFKQAQARLRTWSGVTIQTVEKEVLYGNPDQWDHVYEEVWPKKVVSSNLSGKGKVKAA